MTPVVAADPAPTGIVTALYLRTKSLHLEAERSGIIRHLLRGEASREGYVLFLRNLLPAYRAMELGLERHRRSPALGALADYRLDRASALESDLVELYGQRWKQDLPLLVAGKAYAGRVAEAADGDGTRLIAHAYTRYLGDLSGGQILRRLLTQSLALRSAQLSFYDFPNCPDLDALKATYRNALNSAGAHAADAEAIVEEGAFAFSLNIALSCAVEAMVARGSTGAKAVP